MRKHIFIASFLVFCGAGDAAAAWPVLPSCPTCSRGYIDTSLNENLAKAKKEETPVQAASRKTAQMLKSAAPLGETEGVSFKRQQNEKRENRRQDPYHVQPRNPTDMILDPLGIGDVNSVTLAAQRELRQKARRR